MNKLISVLALILVLTGCATPRIPFPEAELAAIDITGDKTLNGEIFLINQLDEKQVGSEQEIILEPVSSYSDHWYRECYMGKKSIQKADPKYENYVMRTKSDKEGKFSFSNIAPGQYYLSGTVGWRALNCSVDWVTTYIPISNKIEITGKDNVLEVKLTKPYTSPAVICDLYSKGNWEEDRF